MPCGTAPRRRLQIHVQHPAGHQGRAHAEETGRIDDRTGSDHRDQTADRQRNDDLCDEHHAADDGHIGAQTARFLQRHVLALLHLELHEMHGNESSVSGVWPSANAIAYRIAGMVVGQQHVGQREQRRIDDTGADAQQQDAPFAREHGQHDHAHAVEHQAADIHRFGTVGQTHEN